MDLERMRVDCNDKTNTTYDTADAQTKKNCIKGSALEWSIEKLGGGKGWGLNQFYLSKELLDTVEYIVE